MTSSSSQVPSAATGALAIPPYSGTAENRSEISALHRRLQSLRCQSLALAVREWFEANPDWDDPFVISFAADKDNQLRAEFRAADYADLSEAKKVRLEELADTLGPQLLGSNSEFVHDLSDTLTLIKWNPRYLDRALSAVLRDHTGLDGLAFLAQVDANKSEHSPALIGQPMEELPSSIALSDELDLRAASEHVGILLTQRLAEDLLGWIEARQDDRGYFPAVVAVGRGVYRVQADPNDIVPPHRQEDVQALIDIFHADGLGALARTRRFAELFCDGLCYAQDSDSLTGVLRKALESAPVPIDLAFIDALHASRQRAALEVAIIPAPASLKGRM